MTQKYRLVSPNDMQANGIRIMLNGKDPVTYEDWTVLCNFWASNAAKGVEESICKLMALMYSSPLKAADIKKVAAFQQRIKT